MIGMGGLTGEIIGRELGKSKALEELSRLSEDSKLRQLMEKDGLLKRRDWDPSSFPFPSSTENTPGQISALPTPTEEQRPKGKTNQYGDVIE